MVRGNEMVGLKLGITGSFKYNAVEIAVSLLNNKNYYTAHSINNDNSNKSTPVISVSDTEVTYGSTFTVDDSQITGGDITVTSSNTSVATVSGLVITPVAVGSTTITVSTAENELYEAGSETFLLNVTPPASQSYGKNDIYLDFTTNVWNFPVAATFAENSYSNGIYTIKVKGYSPGGYYYSTTSNCLLLGKSDAYLTLPAFDRAVKQIVVGGQSGGSASVTQNIFVGSSPVSTQTTSSKVTHTYDINNNKQSAGTIYKLKVTNENNTRISFITVVAAVPGTEDVTLKPSGYATYCSQYPLDFSDHATADYSAWQVIEANSSTGVITFEQITGSIQGGQGILLKGTPNATVTLTSIMSTNELSDNKMIGTTAPTYVPSDTYYGLSAAGDEFVKVNAGTAPAGKALLPVANVSGGSSVKALNFVFNEANGIVAIDNGQLTMDNFVYDLQGRRVAQPTKGLYIVNGKKVFIK